METQTLVKVIVGIVIVIVAIPFVPKILDAIKGPDPAMDAVNLERIQEAVLDFGDAEGQSPTSLGDLVPKYLDAIPSTHDGRAYAYNSETGFVGMPERITSDAGEPSGSGLTPMGDAITGLSVHEELDF